MWTLLESPSPFQEVRGEVGQVCERWAGLEGPLQHGDPLIERKGASSTSPSVSCRAHQGHRAVTRSSSSPS